MITKTVFFAAALLLTTVSVTSAQIVTPDLTLPPCTGDRCFLHPRGATTQPVHAPSVLKHTCPQGTVYDAYKGTCKVIPVAH